MKRSIHRYVAAVAAAAAAITGCSAEPREKSRTSTSAVSEDGSDDLLTNARIVRTQTQIRLENIAREACRGRETLIDIEVGNNHASEAVQLSAVAHGYRNGETVPVQITSIGQVYVGAYQAERIAFDGKQPGKKGSAIEVVSVTLDAEAGSTFQDLGVNAKFTCGDVDRTDPGVDPGTGTVQDPSQIACADLAALRGASYPLCEFNGNGGCGGRGSRTNDCDHCCNAVGPGQTEPL